jgi:ubiquinone/menaquinone biosynthesis C-methylase UbiE
MNRSAKFWDKIAKRYAKSPVSDEAAYQNKLRLTRDYFQPDMEVLEFGCGTGSTAIIHAAYVKHILAIDFSTNILAIAQGKADAKKITNITFKRSAIEQFSVPDHSFDAVLGHSILHLLEDREGVIAKVHKMLKPGGLFITRTVCLGDTMKFVKFILPIGKFLRLMPLVKVFTVQELLDSITESGFEIDHQWQPGKGKSVFIVAKKVG